MTRERCLVLGHFQLWPAVRRWWRSLAGRARTLFAAVLVPESRKDLYCNHSSLPLRHVHQLLPTTGINIQAIKHHICMFIECAAVHPSTYGIDFLQSGISFPNVRSVAERTFFLLDLLCWSFFFLTVLLFVLRLRPSFSPPPLLCDPARIDSLHFSGF